MKIDYRVNIKKSHQLKVQLIIIQSKFVIFK